MTMAQSIGHPLVTGNRRAPLSIRGNDLRETPAVAVYALLRAEKLPLRIWEPACGPGAIVRILRAAGHEVLATDLVDYGSPDQNHSGWDFLLERRLPDRIECIISNPPFKLAENFVAHALELCPRVIVLLRLAFMEAERKSGILDDGRLARVLVFRERLPMMPRADWEGPRLGNAGMAFAWYVFDQAHRGAATIHRISWRVE
jgi:hypothetical protein